jgi:hypothetical protein
VNTIIEELENNIKIRNTGGLFMSISAFKQGYQPRSNIVMDERPCFVADCYTIEAWLKNYFSQLLIVHGVSNVT